MLVILVPTILFVCLSYVRPHLFVSERYRVNNVAFVITLGYIHALMSGIADIAGLGLQMSFFSVICSWNTISMFSAIYLLLLEMHY